MTRLWAVTKTVLYTLVAVLCVVAVVFVGVEVLGFFGWGCG